MIRRSRLLVLLAFLPGIGAAFGLAEARADLPKCREGVERARCEKPWSVFVYMAADNNLSAYAESDLKELAKAGSDANIDVVVQLDRPGADGLERSIAKKGSVQVLESVPEKDYRNEEKKLADFLKWGRARFPSRRNAVILWGHGMGWSAKPARDEFVGGFGWNDGAKRAMSIPSLRKALLASGGGAWDLALSDACLMQSAEIVTELAGTARYLVGTSGIQALQGFPYAKLLALLRKGLREPDPAYAVARDAVELLPKKDAESQSLSVVTSAEWTDVFLPKARAWIDGTTAGFAADRFAAADFFALQADIPHTPSGTIELGLLLRASAENARDENVRAAANAAIEALDRAILAYRIPSKEASFGRRSLSVYFPDEAGERKSAARSISKSEWNSATGFAGLLAP